MRHLKVELRAPSRETALALVGLLALALFHSREAVFEGRAFFVRDLHLQWYGQVESFVGAIAAGSWPLWDPYVSFGQPMLANANTEILYPLTWLNLLMRPWAYYTLFFLFHLVVAGMGVRALGRRLGLSATGAWLAGSAWVSAGPFLSLGNAWNHLAAAAWMPWALLAAERAFDAPTLRSSVIWGGALALLILAGSPDFLAMTALATLALFVARLDWRRLASRAHGRLLGVGLGAVLLASGLAAGQVLPSLDVAERSDRFRLSEEERTYWSVHPASLLETALPVFWDDLPLSATWRAALYESREPYLISLYIGAPLLALAAAGLVSPASRRRGALGAVAAICSLVSLGRHAPFYGMAMALFPPLKVVRFPAKALVLASLMAVLLAAMGWEAWRQGDAARRQRPRRALGLALFLLTTSCLGLSFFLRHLAEAASWRLLGAATCGAIGLLLLRLRESRARSAALAGGAMAALVVLPLALVHRNLNPTAPRELFTARPAVLDAVHQDDRRRLFVYDYLAARGRSQRYLKREVPYIVPAAKREPRSLWLGALGMRRVRQLRSRRAGDTADAARGAERVPGLRGGHAAVPARAAPGRGEPGPDPARGRSSRPHSCAVLPRTVLRG
jgi:hypothetical protein